jgi:hypothetical protein
MFEDIQKEPEDILAGVDKGGPPLNLPTEPKTAPPQIEKPSQPLLGTEIKEPKVFWKKFLIIAVIVVAVVGGVMGYLLLRKPKTAVAPSPKTTPAESAPQVAPPVVEQAPETVTPQPPPPIDSDGDGLTDEEEKILGTNPNNPDSDNDELSDREEVKVYLTDPLNPDTDKDGYPDGHEVKNGYDPKGPGKLFKVPPPQQ